MIMFDNSTNNYLLFITFKTVREGVQFFNFLAVKLLFSWEVHIAESVQNLAKRQKLVQNIILGENKEEKEVLTNRNVMEKKQKNAAKNRFQRMKTHQDCKHETIADVLKKKESNF